jgi:CrcB protein
MNALLVFLGGGLGALCRFGVSRLFPSSVNFPWATLSVNLLGCFAIGVFSFYAMRGQNTLIMLGIIGFLGGFTTFSSYGLELMRMLESGLAKNFVVYLLASNVIGVLLVYVGYRLACNFIK